jgi:hypothetical protein
VRVCVSTHIIVNPIIKIVIISKIISSLTIFYIAQNELNQTVSNVLRERY